MHYTLRLAMAVSLTAIGCHSLGIYRVILLSLLSVSIKVTVPPRATGEPDVQPSQHEHRVRRLTRVLGAGLAPRVTLPFYTVVDCA